MAEGNAPSASKPVDWANYARDAREFLLTVSHVGPTAARVWTNAWCSWAISAADFQKQMARQWTEIIREPGLGMDTLEKMRQDHKTYLAKIAGIPELAVLEFAESMEETAGSPGKDVPRPDQAAFVKAAESFEAVAMEVANEVMAQIESEAQSKTKGSQPSYKDPRVERLEQKIAELKVRRERLRKVPDQSAG